MINKNDREQICAYIDEQLTVSEKADFETRLAEESQLQELFIQFKQADLAYRQATDEHTLSPPPEQVMALLEPAQSNKVSLFRAWPIAASLAAITITVALLTTEFNDRDNIKVAIFAALDNTPSSTLIWLDESHSNSMLINLSFKHRNGQYCREFVLDKQGQASRQVACKDQQWNIEVTLPSAPLIQHEAYLPAGDSQNSEIEDYLNQSMQGDGFNLLQEQDLIQKNWK